MNRYFKITFLSFFISCSSNSNESKNSILKEIQKDTSIIEKTETTDKASLKEYSENDSVAFYNSTNTEEKIIIEYCDCAQKHGGTSPTCRDLIKKLAQHQNISDEILNKYFNNTTVFQRLKLRVSALNNKFNDCNNYTLK